MIQKIKSKAAANIAASLLAGKSRTNYENFYKRFVEWNTPKKIKDEAKDK